MELFDADTFGDYKKYRYPQSSVVVAEHCVDDFFEEPHHVESTTSETLSALTLEVVNLEAMVARSRMSVSDSGERRLHHLVSAVNTIRSIGYPVVIKDGGVQRCNDSQFWAARRGCRQSDGYGPSKDKTSSRMVIGFGMTILL